MTSDTKGQSKLGRPRLYSDKERAQRKVESRKRWRAANPEKQRTISREASRERRRKFPDEAATYTRSYYRAHPEHMKELARRGHYRRLYGITPERKAEMLVEQGGCGICKTNVVGTRWHVDHVPKTKTVRAILCHHCNIGLGNFRDSPELLFAAARYLEGNP